MRFLKKYNVVLLLLAMMVLTLTACGSTTEGKKDNKETKSAVEKKETTDEKAEDAKEETNKDEALSDATITEDEAIKLVKKEMGDDFSYIPADELKEQDGSKYYEIYVKQLLDEGNMTTVATYMVKEDGSEVFDKDAVNFTGEYVRKDDNEELTFVVSKDNTFEMRITGNVNQVVSGGYKLGVTESADVISLILYPNKSVTDGKEETVEDVEGTATIEGDKLTLSMESEPTEFTKK